MDEAAQIAQARAMAAAVKAKPSANKGLRLSLLIELLTQTFTEADSGNLPAPICFLNVTRPYHLLQRAEAASTAIAYQCASTASLHAKPCAYGQQLYYWQTKRMLVFL